MVSTKSQRPVSDVTLSEAAERDASVRQPKSPEQFEQVWVSITVVYYKRAFRLLNLLRVQTLRKAVKLQRN